MNIKNSFMLRAIELSIESVDNNGGPFGCVIVKNNKIIAEGNQNVKDLYKEFNLELPEIESSTIGGYIMDLAKKIPLYGEIINDKYFNYKVISHSRKQILRVEISQIN